MLRTVAAIVALCSPFAALILYVDWRHSLVRDPRRASWRTVRNCKAICVAALVLLVMTAAAHARPSPYPPPDQFSGDRYTARQAQMGPEVAREAQRQRAAKKLNRRATAAPRKRPPVSRQKWRAVPVPAPRPLAYEPYRVDAPITVIEGVKREAVRAIGGRPAGCPSRWCGCYLARLLGIQNRNLWLARNWASVGSNAGGPRIGAIVVWSHHVGLITGRTASGWIIKSGNDGRAVRERARSIAGAIAYRTPS